MHFTDRQVVVTGGTGALGIAVVGALLAAGATCHVPYRSDAEADRFPHRGETRGVGGIFFDYLGAKGEHPPERIFEFVMEAGRAFIPAYAPIVQRRSTEPYGETERTWQLRRRGRYVEFNLIYDRGTIFGLKTNGRIESILMSLPPLVRWDYDVMPQPGSPEAELVAHLRPNNWLDR